MLGGLRTVVFQVADLEAAKWWYISVLGNGPYFDEDFYVGFDVAGFELGLVPAGEGRAPGVGGDTPYWAVSDVAATFERLLRLGAEPLEAPHEVGGGIVVGAVRDPFGNALGVIFNPHFKANLGAPLAADTFAEAAIVREVGIEATPSAIWARFASAEGLQSWLVPEARVDLRPGGRYELLFDAEQPEGSRGTEGCVVLGFVPGRMLSFTWNAPPDQPTRGFRTWVVLEIEAEGQGSRVRITHTGWPQEVSKPGDWAETFAYFETAWRLVLEQLVEAVSRPQPAGH